MNEISQEHLKGILQSLAHMFSETDLLIRFWWSMVKVMVALNNVFVLFYVISQDCLREFLHLLIRRYLKSKIK